MSQHGAVTIRCWQLTGETALDETVLGVDERAVRDGINVLSSDEFDACLVIVVCRMSPISMRTSRKWRGIAGVTPSGSRPAVAVPDPEGMAYEIKPVTRIHSVPEPLIGPDSQEGIAVFHRVAVMHYLLDMG